MKTPRRSVPGRAWFPYVVLACGLLLTVITAVYSSRAVRAEHVGEIADHERFLVVMNGLSQRIDARVRQYEQMLRSSASLVEPDSAHPLARFDAFVSSPDVRSHFPGVERLEFARRAADARFDQAGVASALARLTTDQDPSGVALDATPIAGEPNRLLLVMPVARTPTPDTTAMHDGFVYGALRLDSFVRAALDTMALRDIRFRIFSALDTMPASLVFDSHPVADAGAIRYRAGTAIDMFGRPWAVIVDALPGFAIEWDDSPLPTVLITGGLLTAIVFGLTLAQRRASERAWQGEAQYALLFNGTPVPMWLYDSETLRILAVNEAAIEHYGYTRDEFHSLTIKDLRPRDEVDRLMSHFVGRPADSHGPAGLWRHCTKDGREIEVEITSHPITFKGRIGELVVAIDVSERRRADRTLHESETRLRQMADHINEAFFVVDLRTRTTLYISPTFSDIWGRPLAEGYDPEIWFQALHPDDRAELVAAQAAVRRGESPTSVFRVIRPDGGLRWVRGRTFPVRNEAGEIYRMVGVAEDITELRQAEARYAQAQKMEAVGRLAGGIAHDFNNLLTVILGEADQLCGTVAAGAPEAKSVDEIQQAARRAAALTRQLLAFSRKQLVAPVVFDLTEAVKAMSSMCRRLIGENIEFTTRFAPDTWPVRADPGQIEQVVANLVVNARDAMPQGGRLTIATENATLDAVAAQSRTDAHTGEYAVMIVSDTGTGMTDEVRSRLFEPFFTTKDVGHGTGLGLATCYGIVKQAGGHMSIYSEVGLGTTVKVYLPRAQAATAEPHPSTDVTTPRGGETILLVEDEPAVRRIASRLLQAQGYQVLEAGEGESAVRLAESHPGEIHLLLTDVILPGMGGREIAELVRTRRPGIRVLFASGYTDDVILQHRLLERDMVLLQKPFSRDSLNQKVREVLDGPLPKPADGEARPKLHLLA